MVIAMRFLPILVLAGLPFQAFAQDAGVALEKAASTPVDAALAPEELGLPANPDAAKTAELAGSKGNDAQLSDFDIDKIAGNEPEAAPLAMRVKAPGQVPDGVTEADFGQPANGDAPKTLDLAASHAESQPTTHDDDKIAGNDFAGSEFDTGPLAERQKLPSDLLAGTDPNTFGQPAIDAPKEADLGLSKAEIAVPNIEDNDKIAGNPYIAPPLLPRQKLPATLPDPVADADMGQPAIDAPKVDLAVSKASDGRPTFEDNDKIDGNPVVFPPMAERFKAPSYDAVVDGLSDDALGLPLVLDAVKVATVDVGKAAEAVTTEYDEDKIAGNSFDPAYADEYGMDTFAPAPPPPELVAQVRALLDDPATRTATLDAVKARGLAPEAVVASFQSFLGILYDVPAIRDQMATEIARVFMDVGLTPDNPAAVGRMASEYIASYGETEAWLGTSHRSIEEQRSYLTDLLRVAGTLTPAQCGPYLDGTMDAAQQRRLFLTAIAGWTEDERTTVFIHRAAAIMADAEDNPAFTPMPEQEMQRARTALGVAALAAIDAAENGPALLAAFGDPSLAAPQDNCMVQKLILQSALAKTGPDGDLWVRYLVENGWNQ